ncbi:hypothetical protein J1N35_011188 [Gossypium stocksii]|uniref:Uncharacterized protein n=1 Tax=Gossypium stocksii TaxID=47602 RepID=A0A9D3W3J7_9ROSI|nr:hypothetical protein J1N35_011188 [Gossypium stocksii]
MLKKCPKKFIISKKEKLKGKALRLGSSTRCVEAKEVERKKNLVECFLCHSLHRLEKCLKKSSKGMIRQTRSPNSLVRAREKLKPIEKKGAKRSKKKLVKCFLCRGLSELQNCPKQVVVKEKATSKLIEPLKWLPPKEEVSLSSTQWEKVTMKTTKLAPIRLNSSKATELVELSTMLPPMEEVSLALNLEEEVAMHTFKLGSMRLISVDTSEELPPMEEVGYASTFEKVMVQVG